MADSRHLGKIEKSTLSQRRSPRNLARWRRLTILTVPTIRFQTGSRNKAVSHMRIQKWHCRS